MSHEFQISRISRPSQKALDRALPTVQSSPFQGCCLAAWHVSRVPRRFNLQGLLDLDLSDGQLSTPSSRKRRSPIRGECSKCKAFRNYNFTRSRSAASRARPWTTWRGARLAPESDRAVCNHECDRTGPAPINRTGQSRFCLITGNPKLARLARPAPHRGRAALVKARGR